MENNNVITAEFANQLTANAIKKFKENDAILIADSILEHNIFPCIKEWAERGDSEFSFEFEPCVKRHINHLGLNYSEKLISDNYGVVFKLLQAALSELNFSAKIEYSSVRDENMFSVEW